MLMPLPNGALMSVAPNDLIWMQFDIRVDARWELLPTANWDHRSIAPIAVMKVICQAKLGWQLACISESPSTETWSG
jgi:hypothetical protein